MENKKTRSHSGFYAVAGTAAALALAGGSLLGVNWLHENIGVSAGGAGYHDDTAADIAEPGGDILQAVGDIIRFGDMTVTITEADFDGQFLRVACKPEFTGEAPEGAEPGNIEICVRDGSSNVLIQSSTSSYNEETGCCTVGCYVDLKPGQIAKISFSSPEYHKDMTDFDIGEHGNYTLTGMNIEGIAYVGETEPGTTVTVTKFGAFIESTNNYAEYDRFRVAVIYNDGTEKVLTDRRQRTGYDHERVGGYSGGYLYNFEAMTGSVSLFSDSAEPIDVENIASVTIDAVQLDHTTVDGWTEAGNADSSVNVNDTTAPVSDIEDEIRAVSVLLDEMTRIRDGVIADKENYEKKKDDAGKELDDIIQRA
ncbi:MAG: hypothetical protein K5876_03635, partial [Ruminiclostridium sp.]|nr:hypothetical protein [Ruminiclostridium sp.]